MEHNRPTSREGQDNISRGRLVVIMLLLLMIMMMMMMMMMIIIIIIFFSLSGRIIMVTKLRSITVQLVEEKRINLRWKE
jgi:hypothetical protein